MNAHAWWVVTVLFLALTPLAAAKTYVVNQRHPAAAGQNAGTADKPFATITAAAQFVKPGDEVLIHGGAYREEVVVEAKRTICIIGTRAVLLDDYSQHSSSVFHRSA